MTEQGADALVPRVIVLGWPPHELAPLADGCLVCRANDEQEMLRLCTQCDATVLVLGPAVPSLVAHRIILGSQANPALALTRKLVIGVEASKSMIEDWIEGGRIFYLSRRLLSHDAMRSLIAAATTTPSAAAEPDVFGLTVDMAGVAADHCLRLLDEASIDGIADRLVEALEALVSPDQVELVTVDPLRDLLRGAGKLGGARKERTVSGLLSYVARTAKGCQLIAPERDPRFDPDVDGMYSGASVHFLARPLLGSSRRVVAIVALSRRHHVFEPRELRSIELATQYASASCASFDLRRHAQKALFEESDLVGDSKMYRQEALAHKLENSDDSGSVLQALPRWLAKAHYLSVGGLLVSLLAMSLVKVNEYASGPALVRARTKFSVVAPHSGVVRSVEVAVGDRVSAGDLMIRMVDTPGTSSADRVAEQVWASGAGFIGEVRVRAGQLINQSEVVATIVDDAAGFEVVAFVPGNYAPQMRPGIPLILTLQGYQGAFESISIDHVGAEVLPAQEALRYAVREGAAAVAVDGPVVIVDGRLRRPTFSADRRSYRYRDGMTGRADVSVRQTSLVMGLLKGMREAFAQ
jgi:hypothetical protein